MLGLHFRARAFSSSGERGPLFIMVRGPLTLAASLVVEHGLQTRRLSSCGSRAQPLRGMWDPPRPGLEPVSPALAGRLPTTAPPGKPRIAFLKAKQIQVLRYRTRRGWSKTTQDTAMLIDIILFLIRFLPTLSGKIQSLKHHWHLFRNVFAIGTVSDFVLFCLGGEE